jgi:DNA-binding NarL/FixJ family response regulator
LLVGWTKYEGLVLDADDYLAKPIEPRALVPRVAKLLDKSTRRIKVLVVDDHAIVREGIRALLALQRDMQVIGEAVNGQEALEKTFELTPDVVLMDIVMPVMNGLEATKRICSKWDRARILMLSQYDDDENVLASNQAGALGFVPKRSAGAELLDGIRSVSQGKPFVHTVAA